MQVPSGWRSQGTPIPSLLLPTSFGCCLLRREQWAQPVRKAHLELWAQLEVRALSDLQALLALPELQVPSDLEALWAQLELPDPSDLQALLAQRELWDLSDPQVLLALPELQAPSDLKALLGQRELQVPPDLQALRAPLVLRAQPAPRARTPSATLTWRRILLPPSSPTTQPIPFPS